jgi:hypothetical protein
MSPPVQAPSRKQFDKRYIACWAAVTLLIGTFYLTLLGTAFDRFVWSDHLDGYYDLLARSFVNGHLYLPVEPRPELLALKDPFEVPANRPYRLLDAALYHNRYYLYHGAAPALFVFAPWRLLTRHDLPQGIAVFLFCLGGYLFLSLLLLDLLAYRGPPVPLWFFVLFCIALGLAQGVPFLLQLTLVYEVAIASGYFCLSAGFYFLFKTLTAAGSGVRWAVLCGLFLGLAIGCRPHLGLAIPPAMLFIALRRGRPAPFLSVFLRRELFAFLLPVLVCGLALCTYNYVRFAAPLEFGLRYQLGEPVYMNVHLAIINIVPGLYYLLACAPDLDPVFPFLRLAIRPPFNSIHWELPARYFLEPTTGALYLFPPALIALAAPFFLWKSKNRGVPSAIIAALYLYSVSCIVFIAATGLNSQRFEVDFLPYLVVICCALIPEQLYRFHAPGRRFWSVALSAAILYSVGINLLYAVQGPFDQWLRNRPANYIRLAHWFSPVQRFRPELNPRLHVSAYFDFHEHCPPGPFHPLMGVGKLGSRYMLAASCHGDDHITFFSDEGPNIRTAEATIGPGGLHLVEIEFTPQDRVMNIRLDNKTILQHPLDFLITAPFQIRCGRDDSFALKRRFDGRIVVMKEEMSAFPARMTSRNSIRDVRPGEVRSP